MKETTHIGVYKNNFWCMQSKMVLTVCEGISCSSFYVKKIYAIAHKKSFFLVKLYWIFGHSLPQITSEHRWACCVSNTRYKHNYSFSSMCFLVHLLTKTNYNIAQWKYSNVYCCIARNCVVIDPILQWCDLLASILSLNNFFIKYAWYALRNTGNLIYLIAYLSVWPVLPL